MSEHPLNVRIEAVMDIAPAVSLPGFDVHAREIGFPVTCRPDHVTVHLIGGDLYVEADGSRTRLTIAAPDQVMLQMLRDYVSHQVSLHGLHAEWRGHRAVGQPDSHARARVVSSVRISPCYYRVTVVGRDLMRFDNGWLHFRVLIRPEGQDFPTADANGVTQWPGGIGAWHRPIYTTRALRKGTEAAELDFDIVVHSGGRMTDWAARVEPGTEVVLVGPAGNRSAIPAGWQGFVGDETAVPGIAGQLAALPVAARGQAILVVPSREDIQDMPHPPGVSVTWALRAEGETPLTALRLLDVPAEDRSVFFVANGREAEAARRTLLQGGLAKSECVTVAYWGKLKD